MKRLIALFGLFCTVSLNACSGDKYDKYVGLWEGDVQRFTKIHIILEIEKRGESYVMIDRIINDSVLENREPDLLTKRDGQLAIDHPMGSIPVAFGENADTLLIMRGTLKRITPERLEQAKMDIKRKKEEEAAHQKKCEQIVEEAQKEYREIDDRKGVESSEKNNLKCAAQKQYQRKYDEAKCGHWPLGDVLGWFRGCPNE